MPIGRRTNVKNGEEDRNVRGGGGKGIKDNREKWRKTKIESKSKKKKEKKTDIEKRGRAKTQTK